MQPTHHNYFRDPVLPNESPVVVEMTERLLKRAGVIPRKSHNTIAQVLMPASPVISATRNQFPFPRPTFGPIAAWKQTNVPKTNLFKTQSQFRNTSTARERLAQEKRMLAQSIREESMQNKAAREEQLALHREYSAERARIREASWNLDRQNRLMVAEKNQREKETIEARKQRMVDEAARYNHQLEVKRLKRIGARLETANARLLASIDMDSSSQSTFRLSAKRRVRQNVSEILREASLCEETEQEILRRRRLEIFEAHAIKPDRLVRRSSVSERSRVLSTTSTRAANRWRSTSPIPGRATARKLNKQPSMTPSEAIARMKRDIRLLTDRLGMTN